MTKAYSDWVDLLGAQTEGGRWDLFITISYRTPNYPWGRGFPLAGAGRPSACFGQRLFDRLVQHLETELHSRVEFVVSDEYGTRNGRFHQHAVLAATGLDAYSCRSIERWLKTRAGWSRVLRFRGGAARYVGKNIGGKLGESDWRIRVGRVETHGPVRVGRQVIAPSAAVPNDLFHQSLRTRKR